MTILVTGAAGFIGSSVAKALLGRGQKVLGIDNLNDYYDVGLKQARLKALTGLDGFSFRKLDISDREAMLALVPEFSDITGIINLAAQAGVRHSLVDPYIYVTSNVMGQVVMLEVARRLPALRHFVYASSSSVYGSNAKMPFSVGDPVEGPNSLYAATKRADEMIGHTYAHLYGIPVTGLRLFTVYGPWGRPDMAPILFARAILAGQPIRVFNHGEMWRDFTYIDDIVKGVVQALDRPPVARPPLHSITWAIIAAKSSPISSARSKGRWAARRNISWSRSSPATCPAPMPILTPARASWASRRPRPSASAFPNSSPGTANIIASDRRNQVRTTPCPTPASFPSFYCVRGKAGLGLPRYAARDT